MATEASTGGAGPDAEQPFSIHAAQRTLPNLAMLALMSSAFVAGLSVPSIARAVGVHWTQGALASAALLFASIVAFGTYRSFGASSSAYRWADRAETFVVNACICYLIFASNTAFSFFWIFYLAHVLMTAFGGLSPVYGLSISVGPGLLTAWFFARGDGLSGWLSALAGLSGLLVYVNLARLYENYRAALQREAELRSELGRLLVTRERSRIARELHDGVSTELTALIWKVRAISGGLSAELDKASVAGVAERLRTVVGEIREVVLALRGPEASFAQLVSSLEHRTRELCGQMQLRFEVQGELSEEELGVFKTELLPMCFELVHNAARHSSGTCVELELKLSDDLRLRLRDDGVGLAAERFEQSRGGLQGVRERVARLGGEARMQPVEPGTCLVVKLPRPLGVRA